MNNDWTFICRRQGRAAMEREMVREKGIRKRQQDMDVKTFRPSVFVFNPWPGKAGELIRSLEERGLDVVGSRETLGAALDFMRLFTPDICLFELWGGRCVSRKPQQADPCGVPENNLHRMGPRG